MLLIVKKLRRCLGFVKITINDKKIISEDTTDALFTWVDKYHEAHNNMGRETGEATSMGQEQHIANHRGKI